MTVSTARTLVLDANLSVVPARWQSGAPELYWGAKDPADTLDYSVSLAAWLADVGDTIANVTAAVTPGSASLTPPTSAAGVVSVVVAGGVVGQRYGVTWTVTTAGGRGVGLTVWLDCAARNAQPGQAGAGQTYQLPVASTAALGGVIVGGNLLVDAGGTLSAISAGSGNIPASDTLHLLGASGTAGTASAVAVGPGVTLANGTLSASGGGGGGTVTQIVTAGGLLGGTITSSGTIALGIAGTTTLGGVIVGAGLSIDAGGTLDAISPGNTLVIGTVTTGSAGSPAAASLIGTPPHQTLDLTIPTGLTGTTGATGPAGPANTLSLGAVTSGPTAAAAIIGTPPNQTLDLTLPMNAAAIPAGTTAELLAATGVAGEATTAAVGGGLAFSAGTLANAGVLSIGGAGGAIAAGTGITVASGTIYATGTASANETLVASGLVTANGTLGGTIVGNGTLGVSAPGAGIVFSTGTTLEPAALAGGLSLAGNTLSAAGVVGQANTLTIGTVTTAAAGSSAAASITGTPPGQTLDLTIPTGLTGATGATGPAGPANTLAIGTVTTGPTAAASITGSAPNQTLDLTLPSGGGGGGTIPAGTTSELLGATGTAGVAATVSLAPGVVLASGVLSAASAYGPLVMTAGRYYCPPTAYNAGATNPAPQYYPFFAPNGFTLQSLTMLTTGTSTGTMYGGLYADNGSGQPGTLVASATFTATGAAATLTTTIAPVTLPGGLYWLRYSASAAIAQRLYQGGSTANGTVAGWWAMGFAAPTDYYGSGWVIQSWTDTNGAAPPATPSGLSLWKNPNGTGLIILGT